MKTKMTKRAGNILAAFKKIEEWLNGNKKVQESSLKVFVLDGRSGVYGWHVIVYSSADKRLCLCRGGHGSYGADYESFKTGMPVSNYYYYRDKDDRGCVMDHNRLNDEGNLGFEDELVSFIDKWAGIKKNLLKEVSYEDEIASFEA